MLDLYRLYLHLVNNDKERLILNPMEHSYIAMVMRRQLWFRCKYGNQPIL